MPRQHFVALRMDDDEKRLVDERALIFNTSISGYLRALLTMPLELYSSEPEVIEMKLPGIDVEYDEFLLPDHEITRRVFTPDAVLIDGFTVRRIGMEMHRLSARFEDLEAVIESLSNSQDCEAPQASEISSSFESLKASQEAIESLFEEVLSRAFVSSRE